MGVEKFAGASRHGYRSSPPQWSDMKSQMMNPALLPARPGMPLTSSNIFRQKLLDLDYREQKTIAQSLRLNPVQAGKNCGEIATAQRSKFAAGFKPP